MLDSHCHILPSLDDGSGSFDESLRMLSLLAEFGFTEVCATPHYLKGYYEPSSSLVLKRLRALQQRVDESGVPISLHPGMEYCLDEFISGQIKDLLPLAGGAFVLAEIPDGGIPEIIYDGAELLVREGFTPVIAHPERTTLLFDSTGIPKRKAFSFSAIMHRAPRAEKSDYESSVHPSALFWALSDLGCCFQGNLGSFSGYYGEEARMRADFLCEKGCYDCFGSDGHEADSLCRILKGAEGLKASIAGAKGLLG